MLLHHDAVAPISAFAAGQRATEVPARPLLVRNPRSRYRSSPRCLNQHLLLLLPSLPGSRPKAIDALVLVPLLCFLGTGAVQHPVSPTSDAYGQSRSLVQHCSLQLV